ncbi:hypothetical protein HDE_03484 [Halotydeus destructor]|nr:hypothetical protein HDE_03484 [Halotydeus destructor]
MVWSEEQKDKFRARSGQLVKLGYDVGMPEKQKGILQVAVSAERGGPVIGYLRPEQSSDRLVDKDGNQVVAFPETGPPMPPASGYAKTTPTPETDVNTTPTTETGPPLPPASGYAKTSPTRSTATTPPSGEAAWPAFKHGEKATWPAAKPRTADASLEIKAWVGGEQKVFPGYLGKLKPMESLAGPVDGLPKMDKTREVEATGPSQEEGVFGSGTAFVSLNDSSHPFNPSSWPTLTRQALKDYSGNSWCVDDQSGCIHVNEEPKTAKFVTSRFYNKMRQEICYAYTSKPEETSKTSATAANIDQLIYDFDEDKNTTKTLEELGCKLIQPSLPKPESNLVLGDRNSKLIMKVDGKPWYLGVAQFSIDGNLTVSESLTHEREENRHYLMAKGAANFDTKRNSIPKGKQYCPTTSLTFPSSGTWKPVNGMALDRVFFEHGRLCRRSTELAKKKDSFEHSRMWTLTREADDPAKEHTLSILDIGVRAPSSAIRDIGFDNHSDSAYKQEIAKIKIVRCFVALVPGVLDTNGPSEGPLVNVVNLQDIHPVDQELHIIYLVHSTGKYFTHHVYENVKLVDVDMSGVRDDFRVLDRDTVKQERDHEEDKERIFREEFKRFAASFKELVNRDHTPQNGTDVEDMDEVKIDRGCALNVNGGNMVRATFRGVYNEFWKRVIDPTRAETKEQVEMYRRWQPFYIHDFIERLYLAEPLRNFQPHEIHVVRVADYLRECDRTFRNTVTGCALNLAATEFLSGVGLNSQSTIGEPEVALESTMIQVNVPDERIKCIIYDFKGVETLTTRYYNGDAEQQAMVYFRQALDLNRGTKSPQRLFISRGLGTSALEDRSIRQRVSQRDPDIKEMIVNGYKLKSGNKEVSVDFRGYTRVKWFYFVNSTDLDRRVKVGVANLPFNCRAATVDSHTLYKAFFGDINDDKIQKVKKLWSISKSSRPKLANYQIYGSAWSSEPGKQVVGVLGGQKKLRVAASSTFMTRKADNHTVVFVNNVDYEDIDMQQEHISSGSKEVWSISLCTPGSPDSNHNVRAIAVPMFDVCKGYPLQGFYRVVRMESENLNARSSKIARNDRAILPGPRKGRIARNPLQEESDRNQVGIGEQGKRGRALNGMALDKVFFEYGSLCKTANALAWKMESFEHARMWTLTREADDPAKEYTLSVRDIGVSTSSTPYRDIGSFFPVCRL